MTAGASPPPADLVRLGLRTALRHGHDVTLLAVRDILAAVLPEAEQRVLAGAFDPAEGAGRAGLEPANSDPDR